ncbi:ATP-binding cassette domain-containing protein [Nonomuraea sp. NPDC005692]|uniref:ATP-binding cassette domain-containing protein n=1 Tax=Nonomuraea sp. NPDC005692 TaxID=3157168 RepID=UPI0033C05C28
MVAEADPPLRAFSGGMRRRLDLAASLVGDARILFLDEPTTSLDPHTRNPCGRRPPLLADLDTVTAILTGLTGHAPVQDLGAGLVTVPAADPMLVSAPVHRLEPAGIPADELGLRLPSLDEVFLALTRPDAGTRKVAA